MSKFDYQRRCAQAQQRMTDENIDYLGLAPSSDLVYLTGHHGHQSERLTMFLLPQEGSPTFIVPSFEIPRLEGLDRFFEIRGWGETEDPIQIVRELVTTQRPTTFAICDQIWGVFLLQLQAKLPDARFVPGSDVLAPMRIIKDSDEIEVLREMGRRVDSVFDAMLNLTFAGRTELELGEDIVQLLKAHGLSPKWSEGVASGPNSASPHHRGGGRVIQNGDAIVLEFGQAGNYRDYRSDVTRTLHVGPPSAPFEEVYEIVKRAQAAASDIIRPGVTCETIDAVARNVITDAGYGDYFTHRVGHGLGLDGHEPPYIVHGNQLPVQPGMVFSVEPGIYLPGRFGVRIEDIVVVTEEGVESFYNCSRELTIVH